MSRVLIPALALALVGAACGVPLDSAPETVPMEPADGPELGPTPGTEQLPVTLYLVGDGGVVGVAHHLASPVDAGSVLDYLFDGIDPRAVGLRTSIPDGTELLGMVVEGTTARIDLTRDFAAVGGEEELLAVAQVVLTLTDLPEIEAVSFELEGVPTDVPRADGALTGRPVTAADYRTLAAISGSGE